MKQKMKITIDALMFAIFIYMMSYVPGRGLILHGIMGSALLTLFFIHQLLNLHWYKNLFKGVFTTKRILIFVSDISLLISMILMAVSSVMISGEIFEFSPLYGNRIAKSIHIIASSWMFILMLAHLGIHLSKTLEHLQQKLKSRFTKILYWIFSSLIFLSGIFYFTQSNLFRNMFALHKARAPFELYHYYFKYTLIALSFCIALNLILKLFKKKSLK